MAGIKRVMYALAGLVMVAMVTACTSSGRPAVPTARDGLLDLRTWDFARHGMVPLNGQWRFLWGKLVDPGEAKAQAGDGKWTNFAFPGSWNDLEVDGRKLGAEGYATFALDVLLPDDIHLLGLKSRSVNTAWRVWVNGRPLGGAGTVATTKSEMVPATLPRSIAFQPDSTRITLVVQVSNFHHRKGGFWWPLQLGHYDQIQEARESGLATDLFLLGALLIMGFYHLGLFLLRPKDSSPLYFGIFCLLVGSRMLFINENFYSELMPWMW
ncbi:MAG TPA: 7TM diverse intracellular signaling domain-containing protein, partial [Bacteroidia bacterium]|nr:7TM diverse intracellular signaling domain-containing protein [Bacteroidia bacterium]